MTKYPQGTIRHNRSRSWIIIFSYLFDDKYTCHDHHNRKSRSELLDSAQSNFISPARGAASRVQCNLLGIRGFNTRAFPHLSYFHLRKSHDESICRHNETIDTNWRIRRERLTRKATRFCETISFRTCPMHIPHGRVRGFRVSNLFLCIFLLFAVRIVASLGAVCMRTEKNYVCDGADPL